MDKNLLVEATTKAGAVEKSEEDLGQVEGVEVGQRFDGKLIVAEDVAEGFVSWEACKLWFKGLAGSHPVTFWIVCMGGILFVCVAVAVNSWWLGQWAAQFEHHASSSVNNF